MIWAIPPVITGQQQVTMEEQGTILLELSFLTVDDPQFNYPDDFTLQAFGGPRYHLNGLLLTVTPNFTGTLTVPVRVNNGVEDSETFDLLIQVLPPDTPANTPPTSSGFAPIEVPSNNNDTVLNLWSVFDDEEDDDQDLVLTIENIENPNIFIAVTIDNANGTLRLNYNPDATGTSEIVIRATDTGGLFVEDVLHVTVLSSNTLPVSLGLPTLVFEENPLTMTLPLWDYFDDAEDGPEGLTYELRNFVPDGYFESAEIDQSTGILTVNFTTGAVGVRTIQIRATDSSTAIVNDELTINIQNPVASPQPLGFPVYTLLEGADDLSIMLENFFQDANGSENLDYLIVNISNNELVENAAINPQNILTISFTEFRSGAAVIRIRATNEFGLFAEDDIEIIVQPVNDPPFFDPLPTPYTIEKNAGQQEIPITGITPGPFEENQLISFLAFSGNETLIPNPQVIYTPGASQGLLRFTPGVNQAGTAQITVVAVDNGSNIPPNQNSFQRVMTVIVTDVNFQPTLNAIVFENPVFENDPEHQVALTGISAGPGESQSLTVTATSNNPGLFEYISIDYQSPQTTGLLRFKTAPFQSGEATIQVTVTDSGPSNPPNVNSITRSFQVIVLPVNHPPEFTSQPGLVATVGEVYEYNITTTDPDGDPVVIDAVSVPNWLNLTDFGNGTALLSGTPGINDRGLVEIIVRVLDPDQTGESQIFNLLVNTRPVVAVGDIILDQDTDYVFTAGFFQELFTDPDGNDLAAIRLVSYPDHGTIWLGDVLLEVGAEVELEFLGLLRYRPDLYFNGQDSFLWDGSDGLVYSENPQPINIVIIAVNVPPQIVEFESQEVFYILGSEPISIIDHITIFDPDHDSLTVAELGIRAAGFQSGVDVLDVEPTENISVSYSQESGLLVLSGKAPLAEYEEILKSVTYHNTNPSENLYFNKILVLSLSDGIAYGNPIQWKLTIEDNFVPPTIPTGFTPNQDGANDLWEIEHLEKYSNSSVQVFDQNGIKVFESIGYGNPWDGQYRNQPLPRGPYYFVIDLNLNLRKVVYTGVVTILR